MEVDKVKFVFTRGVCEEGMMMLKGKADYFIADNNNPNNYLDEMADADALIVRIATCDRNVIENSPDLKVIGRTGVGYDCIDVEAATQAGIPIVITPGANNRSVAEHAVGMMFSLAKNFSESEQELKNGNWEIRDAGKSFELYKKKVGFIGLGAIGKDAQKICRGIGMETLGYDPYLSRTDIEELGCTYYDDYRKMIKECDFVSLHVPLLDSTRNMIDKKELDSMKSSAIIINCSRGGIVNEAALIEALNTGKIAGAGLDVFEQEPIGTDYPLLHAKNVLCTPHSAAQTKEAVIRMAQMCIQGCLEVANGVKWPYVADKSVYNHPRWIGAKEVNMNEL